MEIHWVGPGDGQVLASVAPDVFDHAIAPGWSAEFLADPRHHLIVALEDGQVVGMITAVHYVHPDKPPELWINELGVASTHRRKGIGRALLQAMLAHGRELGCGEAWVLTEPENEPARRLYREAGGTEDATVMYSFELDRLTIGRAT
jgi:aminoglycoside 6'-N-acetyltransferase I